MRFSIKGFAVLPTLSLLFKRPSRLPASFSVRSTRVIVLALIPVVGFLAEGHTYVSGEGDVGNAFQTVKQSRALADGSRDFKIAVGAMRIAVKDFATQPHTLIDSFGRSQQLANESLDRIEASIGGAASDNVTATASSVEELAASIGEIASRVAKSTDVAGAVSEAQRTSPPCRTSATPPPASAKWSA
jgi:methyl-accepting chemotaxis protein